MVGSWTQAETGSWAMAWILRLGSWKTILHSANTSLGAICSRTSIGWQGPRSEPWSLFLHWLTFRRCLICGLWWTEIHTGKRSSSWSRVDRGRQGVPWPICPCGFSDVPDDFLIHECMIQKGKRSWDPLLLFGSSTVGFNLWSWIMGTLMVFSHSGATPLWLCFSSCRFTVFIDYTCTPVRHMAPCGS